MPTEPRKQGRKPNPHKGKLLKSCPNCGQNSALFCKCPASPAEAQPAGETPQTERLIEQLCRDLNSAHDEILRAQGCGAKEFSKYDWPEWSPQANSIRWAEKLIKKRLAKTTNWTHYPETGDPAPVAEPLCRCPDKVCLLHPNSSDFYMECSFRNRTLAPVAATAPVPPNEKPKCTCPTIGNCVYVGAGSNCPVHNRVDAPVPPQAPERITIEVYQQDWMPGFAAYHSDGMINETAKAHVSLNIGSFMSAIKTGDLDPKDLPYLVAESLMHEVIHVLEAWAGVEFNEDRVEELLTKYREKYERATVWEYTGGEPHESE